MEIGAGSLRVFWEIKEKPNELAEYFLAEASLNGEVNSTCRGPALSKSRECQINHLNGRVNYTITVRSCNDELVSVQEKCSPPSVPIIAMIFMSGGCLVKLRENCNTTFEQGFKRSSRQITIEDGGGVD